MVTASKAYELAKRKRLADDDDDPLALMTFSRDFLASAKTAVANMTAVRFPSPIYREDPVRFFRDVLGVTPWAKQVEIIEAVREHPRVAVRSGHKVSKSHTAAGVALWFYCSFPDARVVMTSTTSRQVDQILWRELKMMRARSGRCLDCKAADPDGFVIPAPCPHSAVIDGDLGELARTGLKSRDFREIVGFTAREAEAVAGISGRNLLYIIDEASGVPDEIFEAIEGNRAGGARIVMFGNPTKNEGEFYEAFHGKAGHYKTITVSSEETPNVVQKRVVIPGLATSEWIEEKKEEWGPDSALYCIRVKGKHAIAEAGKIFSIHTILTSQQKWADTPEAGRLYIGLDPAGESGTGDESAFSARRGFKQLLLRAHMGLDEAGHLAQLLHYVRLLKLPRETPVVIVDREGSIGSKLYRMLRDYAEENPGSFEVTGLRASDKAMRLPKIYDRMRDELAANLEQWFRDGGAILEDVKLERELHAFEWSKALNGRLKVTPKDKIRKLIGRSPDRYDALAMSAWEPLSLLEALPAGGQQHAAAAENYAPVIMDPYAGANTWR